MTALSLLIFFLKGGIVCILPYSYTLIGDFSAALQVDFFGPCPQSPVMNPRNGQSLSYSSKYF